MFLEIMVGPDGVHGQGPQSSRGRAGEGLRADPACDRHVPAVEHGSLDAAAAGAAGAASLSVQPTNPPRLAVSVLEATASELQPTA